jgi:hypothetical protein
MSENINQIKERIAGNYDHLSNASILSHLQDVVALAVLYLQDLFSIHKTKVETIVASAHPGTIAWYGDQILKFQYGHDLTVIDYKPQYETIDEDAQIIKYVHVTEQLGGIVVKVAKEDKQELLTLNELNAFKDFLHDIKYPGTTTLIVNQPADEVTVDIEVFVNPQILDSNGKHISETDYPVKQAIMDYFNNSVFGGKLQVSKFDDAVQEINGVEDIKLNGISMITHSAVNTTVFDLATGVNVVHYDSEAGHFLLVEENLTITYN